MAEYSYRPLTDWSDRNKRTRRYVEVYVPEHPAAFGGGWIYEHRLVVERDLGRLLEPGETVHHITECRHDNRLVNLFVCWQMEHVKAHA